MDLLEMTALLVSVFSAERGPMVGTALAAVNGGWRFFPYFPREGGPQILRLTPAWRAAWFAVDTRFASVSGEFGFVCV